MCVSDVLQRGVDGLGQAAEASACLLLHHARHPGRPHQDHPVQEPSCGRVLRLAAGSCHRRLSGNTLTGCFVGSFLCSLNNRTFTVTLTDTHFHCVETANKAEASRNLADNEGHEEPLCSELNMSSRVIVKTQRDVAL